MADRGMGTTRCPNARLARYCDCAECRPTPREGMAMVYDHLGAYLGCIGVETWRKLVEQEEETPLRVAPVDENGGRVL